MKKILLVLLLAVGLMSGCESGSPGFKAPETVVVLNFTAGYCPFCWIAAGPTAGLKDLATVQNVSANQHAELSRKYGVTHVPTLIVLIDGQEAFRAEGGGAPGQVREFLENR